MQWKKSRFQSNKIKAEKDKLERAIQHLPPLGLSCVINKQPDDQLNINAREFQLKRNAAPVVDLRLRDQAAMKQEESYIEWTFDNSLIKWGGVFRELPRIGTF